MKICWENIENIRLNSKGNFYNIKEKRIYKYYDNCKNCGNPFLSRGKEPKYCCKKCMSNCKELKENLRKKMKGNKLSEKTKEKISKSNKGKKFTKIHKHNLSESHKGIKSNLWKGGYTIKGIPLYDTYAHQIGWAEEVRRNEQDPNVLEVRCFKCNGWYVPKQYFVANRLKYLKGNRECESRFYCSDVCKNSCSIYHKTSETIMKEDAIKAGRLSWLELEREVQTELRQLVLERNNRCVKCDSKENLQCHHIYPVNIEPLLSADIDNCVTLCKECHKEAHKKDGCGYNQLHMEEC